jgi:formate dehydrogenase formation protein
VPGLAVSHQIRSRLRGHSHQTWPADSGNFFRWSNRTVRVRFGKRRASCATVAKIHISGCDSCRSYIKTVDMTKSGLAEPIVDEMAAIPLDLWAQKEGYTKLQTNLMQL